MQTRTVSHYRINDNGQFVKISDAQYRDELQAAQRELGNNKVKVDDGMGGTAWMFFESTEDMRVWKNQR